MNNKITHKDNTRMELMEELREIVGWRAFNALLNGRPLMIWRCTTPWNWWVPGSPKSDCDYLWHSEGRLRPDLIMFNEGYHSSRKVVEYWGADSGMNEESMYFLKKDYIRLWKQRKI